MRKYSSLLLILAIGLIAGFNIIPDRIDAGLNSATKLLLHCNGTDGSTTVPDSSATGHTVTCGNNAALATAQKAFGSASFYFDGTDDYASIPDHADFDKSGGVWQWDFWIYCTMTPGANSSWLIRDYTDVNNAAGPALLNTMKVRLAIVTSGSAVVLFDHSATISMNTWTHIACGENGDTYWIAVNGAYESTTDTDRLADYTGGIWIGNRQDLARDYGGYIDEIRMLKGICPINRSFTVMNREY